MECDECGEKDLDEAWGFWDHRIGGISDLDYCDMCARKLYADRFKESEEFSTSVLQE